ncbi:MAG TPA: hypothetical protein PKL13_04655 [bacterium]|nr:hypothetical protein [bacterium]
MEKYTEKNLETNISTEPQDEYVCNVCGKIVGLLIDGVCFNCSRRIEKSQQK